MAKLIMTVAEMQDENKWLEMRFRGLGGSDASIVVGLNKWKSPFSLWLEKTGQSEPEDLSDNEYVYWGKKLEQAVSDRFCELTGKKVQKRGLLQSEEYPFMLASVDRMVVGENAGLECKTANGFAGKQWEDDEVPDAYYIQCQHYMAVTGCDKWYIAVLIGGNKFIWKCIERNQQDIDVLIEAEKDFWHKVQNNIMPAVDGSDDCAKTLAEKFSSVIPEAVNLPAGAEFVVKILRETKSAIADLETQKTLQENRLKEMLGSYEVGYIGDEKISWKQQKGRETFNKKQFEKDYPDIAKNYTKIGNTIRVLRIG